MPGVYAHASAELYRYISVCLYLVVGVYMFKLSVLEDDDWMMFMQESDFVEHVF